MNGDDSQAGRACEGEAVIASDFLSIRSPYGLRILRQGRFFAGSNARFGFGADRLSSAAAREELSNEDDVGWGDLLGSKLRRLLDRMRGKANSERACNTNDGVKARLRAWSQRFIETFATQT